ncbi:MAG: ATP-binding cassette domain-containing protein [Solirubrobacterales bacterium]
MTKTYPGVIALTDVSLDLEPGTVHALVGENGAGKSSLVKVITGALVPDSGRLRIGDREVTHLTPQSAQAMGISVIQQERQIVPDLSVAENVMLGHLPGRGGMVDWPAVRRQARQRLAQVGATTDVRRSVRNLAVAELQELEIARALSSDVRVLVMDEPTSALSRPEVERLFAVMRRLREHDVAMLYISHHLEEIFEIADVVTVRWHRRRDAADSLDPDELVRLMLGREVAPLVRAAQATGPSSAARWCLRPVRSIVPPRCTACPSTCTPARSSASPARSGRDGGSWRGA